jgi:hypothetical protein
VSGMAHGRCPVPIYKAGRVSWFATRSLYAYVDLDPHVGAAEPSDPRRSDRFKTRSGPRVRSRPAFFTPMRRSGPHDEAGGGALWSMEVRPITQCQSSEPCSWSGKIISSVTVPIQGGHQLRRVLNPLDAATLPAELADDRTAAVGEDHGPASFDHGRGLRGHHIAAGMKLYRSYADHGGQQGCS